MKNYILLLAFFVISSTMMAQTTWTGLGDGESWSDASNWNSGVPFTGVDAIILITGSSNTTVIVDASAVCNNLTVTNNTSNKRLFVDVEATFQIEGNFTLANPTGRINDLTVVDGATLQFNGSISIDVDSDLIIETGSTVEYGGTVAQTVYQTDYDNITFSGVRTDQNITIGGDITIEGAFNNTATFTTGAVVSTGTTVTFSGTDQTIAAIQYDNLDFTGNRTGDQITLQSGTVAVSGTFSAPSGTPTFVTTGNTVLYNGGSAQTILTDITYEGLEINNSAGANVVTSLSTTNLTLTSGNLGLNDANGGQVLVFTMTGSFLATAGAISTTGDVDIILSGSVTSDLPAITNGGSTNDITISNGTFTQTGAITATTLTISSGTLNQGSNSFTISGNLVVDGTLTGSTGTMVIAAASTASGTGTTNLNNLTINSAITFTSSTGTIGVAGVLTNEGTFAANGGTVDFNGSPSSLAGSVNPSFNDVIISGTLSAPTTLLIGGDFTNNGTFTHNSGTVTFNGTVAQSVAGTAATVFEDLTISNVTATVTVNGTGSSVDGTLTFGDNSSFDANGLVTLTSNASTTAFVAVVPATATVNGNFRVQRYFDGSGDVWRNFGVGVSGATVTNITAAGINISAGNGIAFYDETVTTDTDLDGFPGTVDDGWVLQSTFGNSLSSTLGYSMWVWAADIGVPVSFIGTLNTGDQTPTVNYTSTGSSIDDGWNMVSNPYASTIDWDLIVASNPGSNLDGTVSVWNSSGGVYDTWNGSTGSLTNGLISSGQSFWVHATASPTLTIHEADKDGNSTSFLRIEGLTNHLIVSLEQGANIDKAYIHFREDATDGLDSQFDGLKLSNSIFNLSSLASTGEALSINSMGAIECGKIVKLKLTNISVGTYELKFEDLGTFIAGMSVILTDNFTNTSTVLSEGSTYSFDVTNDELSWGDTRFELEFATAELNTSLITTTTNNCVDDFVSVFIDNTESDIIYELILSGNVVASGVGNGAQIEITVSKSLLVEGTNSFDVAIGNGVCESVNADNPITFEYSEVKEITSVQGNSSCGASSITLSAEGAPGDGSYRWYETLDATNPIEGETSSIYNTPEIEVSTTYYVSINNAQGCESTTRVPVEAIINEVPETPDISIVGMILVSSSKTGNQWYLDGVAIEGANEIIYEITESGNYSVEVNNGTCSARSIEIPMEIDAVTAIDNTTIGNENDIQLYPNPVGNEPLSIDLGESVNLFDELIIIDNAGRAVETIKVNVDMSNTMTVNLNNLENGVYYINLVGRDKHHVFKVLKQ